MITQPITLWILIEFKIRHYKKRLAEETGISERIFIAQRLHDLKKELQTIYN